MEILAGKQHFGEYLKEKRKAMKLSQEKFGELLGVSRAVINNLEGGSQKPTVDFLIVFATELHVSLDAILLPKPVLTDAAVTDLLAVSPAEWSKEQAQEVISYIRQLEQRIQDRESDVARLQKQYDEVVSELVVIQKKLSSITKQ